MICSLQSRFWSSTVQEHLTLGSCSQCSMNFLVLKSTELTNAFDPWISSRNDKKTQNESKVRMRVVIRFNSSIRSESCLNPSLNHSWHLKWTSSSELDTVRQQLNAAKSPVNCCEIWKILLSHRFAGQCSMQIVITRGFFERSITQPVLLHQNQSSYRCNLVRFVFVLGIWDFVKRCKDSRMSV